MKKDYIPNERDGRVRAALMAQKTGQGVSTYAKYLKLRAGEVYDFTPDALESLAAAIAAADKGRDNIRIALNPSHIGLKGHLARYWYCLPENIELKGGVVFQNGEPMNACYMPKNGGFLAYHPDES